MKKSKVKNTEKIESKYRIIRTVVAVLISLIIAFFLIATVSDDPIKDFLTLIVGPLQNPTRLITLLTKMVPLLFTGVAVSLIYKAGQINIAAEGAFFGGTVAATIVAIIPGIPAFIHIPLCILAGGVVGSLIMGLPGILNAKYNVVTIVSSLMMNYIVLYLGLFLMLNLFRDPAAGFESSLPFQESAILPKLLNDRLNIGLIIAVLVVVLGYFIINKTTLGYRIKAIGNNEKFANYSGINVKRTIIFASMIAGFFAGMGGSVEILGNYNRFMYSGFTNHGWDGIMLAVLCRNNPKMIPLGAVFLAYIKTSADALNLTSNIPPEIISVIQAIIIIFVAAERFLSGFERKEIIKNSQYALKNVKEV